MNNYDIIIDDEAIRNMEQIFSYIADSFASIETAEKILATLEDAIYSLKVFPERGALRKTGSYANTGIRQLLSGKYKIIYDIDHVSKKVRIITVRYAMSNF